MNIDKINKLKNEFNERDHQAVNEWNSSLTNHEIEDRVDFLEYRLLITSIALNKLFRVLMEEE